jgi:hypothetical protein
MAGLCARIHNGPVETQDEITVLEIVMLFLLLS